LLFPYHDIEFKEAERIDNEIDYQRLYLKKYCWSHYLLKKRMMSFHTWISRMQYYISAWKFLSFGNRKSLQKIILSYLRVFLICLVWGQMMQISQQCDELHAGLLNIDNDDRLGNFESVNWTSLHRNRATFSNVRNLLLSSQVPFSILHKYFLNADQCDLGNKMARLCTLKIWQFDGKQKIEFGYARWPTQKLLLEIAENNEIRLICGVVHLSATTQKKKLLCQYLKT
jgi:hypothetical protein